MANSNCETLRRGTYAIIALLLFAAAAAAYHPDYFPLQVGNQWIYRQAGAAAGEPVIIEIPRADIFNGRPYALVRGFPDGDAWLRMAEDGALYAYDPVQDREKVWVAFGAPEGSVYFTEITECNHTARIESRNAWFESQIGEFSYALHIVYPPGDCIDGGILSEFYLPYVGLVERTVSTVAGPLTYEMIYARLGGVTFVSAPELSFGLALDRAVYEAAPAASPPEVPVMVARLTLRNTRLEPFRLTYPSGQRFDFILKNEEGAIVYRWSDGKAFILSMGFEDIGPGERNYVVQIPLADSSGAPWPPGDYIAEGWITSAGPKRFSAAAGFEIRSKP